MRTSERVKLEYFEWMYDFVCEGRFSDSITYKRLFSFLHNTTFVYFVPYDENRAEDGIDLRRRYCYTNDCEHFRRYLDGPCSVLEMMLALAIRCEERIMSDPGKGDRTAQWFWSMIGSLGLGSMTDYNFDEDYVETVVEKFLDRDYKPDGRGSLFTIKQWNRDARTVEIWHQLLAYLNTLE